jgi:hypothetical protein
MLPPERARGEDHPGTVGALSQDRTSKEALSTDRAPTRSTLPVIG